MRTEMAETRLCNMANLIRLLAFALLLQLRPFRITTPRASSATTQSTERDREGYRAPRRHATSRVRPSVKLYWGAISCQLADRHCGSSLLLAVQHELLCLVSGRLSEVDELRIRKHQVIAQEDGSAARNDARQRQRRPHMPPLTWS